MGKQIIYQTFTRLFGNRCLRKKSGGTIEENGVGKMNDFTDSVLQQIKKLGATHVWYTGVVRHASCTDYSSHGIPTQHPAVVKGRAGSPYAITDYYDIDPDIACDVEHRMLEFEQLVQRTHRAGLKVIMDFVPNHVARQYQSVMKPSNVKDLGEGDDTGKQFAADNNFYYCPGEAFAPAFDLSGGTAEDYHEYPAKATGNDHFDSHPGKNDWYETVKLNYGIDYLDAGGRSEHFSPTHDTWVKMTDILLFWASKGVDGFRCDMAEMVPPAFWKYSIGRLKSQYNDIEIIGEVYNPALYRTYIASGFDCLYDKVGMYDCLRDVTCGRRPATDITLRWQSVDDINTHMLYFLENHDEQRIASDFFCGDALKAIPALAVTALMRTNPVMIYAGQEYGERGMDEEGFSGRDGRTTIFDYWTVDSIYKGFYNQSALSANERQVYGMYEKILSIATDEKAVAEGAFFDLMYVNPASDNFDPSHLYAFLRKKGGELLLVVANFSYEGRACKINIPQHAFDTMGIPTGDFEAVEMLAGTATTVTLSPDVPFASDITPWGVRIYKINVTMKDDEYVFNAHDKEEFPPAHTAEHLLNQLMQRMFGCPRSTNAHIERKKSKISYVLDHKPSRSEEKAIENEMNRLIESDMPVTFEYVDIGNLPADVDGSRLPADVSDTVRIVRIGDYDACPCIGKHVRSTSQIGRFVMLGTNWDEHGRTFRIRFKIVNN